MRLAKPSIDDQGTGYAPLSRCRELQGFKLVMIYPGEIEVEVLSSITSTNIQKVSLVYLWLFRGSSWQDVNWEIFDKPLCRLADRLGHTHGPEVDFQIMGSGPAVNENPGLEIIANSLAAFKEKGKIRVL